MVGWSKDGFHVFEFLKLKTEPSFGNIWGLLSYRKWAIEWSMISDDIWVMSDKWTFFFTQTALHALIYQKQNACIFS